MTTPSEILTFYAEPAGMTAVGPYEATTSKLAADAAEIARAVQGVMLHEFWAPVYEQTLTLDRKAQSHLRMAVRMLSEIFAADGAPLSVPRVASKRCVGVCRHFSVLACALLRAKAIPARARCGVADYFGSNKPRFGDHWITEYWSGARWVRADFQIDAFQRNSLGLEFDPLDQPPGRFLTGGEAWQLCRAGQADADDFGIFDESGLWFITGNLVRDFASLNKVEMLPWDVWGPMIELGGSITDEDFALFDRLAALTEYPDQFFDDMRSVYERDDGLRPPEHAIDSLRRVVALSHGRAATPVFVPADAR